MDTLTLSGSYADLHGAVPVVWEIASSKRVGWQGRFEVAATIRGIRVSGAGFNGLSSEAASTGLATNGAGDLDNCTITVRIPARIADSHREDGELELNSSWAPGNTSRSSRPPSRLVSRPTPTSRRSS